MKIAISAIVVLFSIQIAQADVQCAPDQALFDGQCREYRTYDWVHPGEITIDKKAQYASPFVISGKARSHWFLHQMADGQVMAPDGTVLWEGLVHSDGPSYLDMIVPFNAKIDVGDYVGEAVLIIRPGDVSDEPTEHSHSIKISITAR